MKKFEVIMVFEHTASMIVMAKNEKEARKLAEEIQFTDHPRKVEEWDGNFGALISVDSCKEIKV